MNRLTLDDGSSRRNPHARHPSRTGSSAPRMRCAAGDAVANVQGVLEQRHGGLARAARSGRTATGVQPANPRTGAPVRAARADLRVAAFNVENYFNGDGRGAGFDDPDNRGARTLPNLPGRKPRS
ncbi:hypothetical protein ACU4GD_08725 [Cupriavidus basilensis]